MTQEGELKNLKVAADLHRRVKAYAAAHGIGLQELTEMVMRGAIGESGTSIPKPVEAVDASGLSSRQRKLVLDIIDVLRAGNPRYEKMLRAAVDVMAGVEVRES